MPSSFVYTCSKYSLSLASFLGLIVRFDRAYLSSCRNLSDCEISASETEPKVIVVAWDFRGSRIEVVAEASLLIADKVFCKDFYSLLFGLNFDCSLSSNLDDFCL